MNKLSWKLDIVIGTYNRPKVLYTFLKTGLNMGIADIRFVIIDDASDKTEMVEDLGHSSTKDVCDHFACNNLLYIRKDTNQGICANIIDFYDNHCAAKYVMRASDKDEFINKQPIINALKKLDADDKLIIVQIPLYEKNHLTDHQLLGFHYDRMNGRDYIKHYVHDTNLQHTAGYTIHRFETSRIAGVPRSLNLRKSGLADLFGFDVDFILKMASTNGDIDFEKMTHMRRSNIGGATEKNPLLFAYCYYQYVKRTMHELRKLKMIRLSDMRFYISWWHLLLLRGLVVIHQPSPLREEKDTSQIRHHLKVPILFYYIKECIRYAIFPDKEKRFLILNQYIGLKLPSIKKYISVILSVKSLIKERLIRDKS